MVCPVGTYSDAGAASCSICGDGEYNDATGASSCTACPSGTFLSDNGNLASFHDSADDCEACAVGSYSNKIGAISCESCTSPEFTSGTGATYCDACVAPAKGIGYYYYPDGNGTDNCHLCPKKGTDCTNKNATYTLARLPIKSRFYRFTSTSDQVYSCSTAWSSDGINCEGGKVAGVASCAEFSRGPLCALCEDAYFLNFEGRCQKVKLRLYPTLEVVLSV